MPLFTVFTPTFNRAALLGRVYESLIRQTFRDFEWLIVDDGSSDGTREVVGRWRDERALEIVYLYQDNQGKHVAFNRAAEKARGALFLPLDSDDTCRPDALDRFASHWLSIPALERCGFSGVTCLCEDDRGAVVGRPFPDQVVDAFPVEYLAKHRIIGEKWGFLRSDVLREYPFPENPGERFVPEGLIWNRIGRRFKIRFVNEALRVYVPRPEGLTRSLVDLRTHSPLSTYTYYLERAAFELPLFDRAKTLANCARFYLHAKRLNGKAPKGFERSLVASLMAPVGAAVYAMDRLRA